MTVKKERDSWKDPYDMSEVAKQADVISGVIQRLRPQIEEVITPDLVQKTWKVYVTGCGDSYYAAVSARMAFEKYSGLSYEPVEALEFSRYEVEYAPSGSIVFPISNSGRVARTIECAVQAEKHGMHTIAITGNTDGPLALSCRQYLIQSIPHLKEEFGPKKTGSLGLGNFAASLITLYLIGIRFGQLRGKISDDAAESLIGEIVSASRFIVDTSVNNLQKIMDISRKFADLKAFCYIGAGPSYGTAQFCGAKLFEQPQLNGISQELEEWAHEQYFLTRPGETVVFVIVPPGRSRGRGIEQIHGIQDMGGTAVAVCDSDDREIIELADYALPVYGKISEEFSPLVYMVPGQMFATSMHQLVGRPPLTPPYDTERMKQVNFRQIFDSKILE